MPPTFDEEAKLIGAGISPVAGVDEAGRGPLAGPVVVAAVILPHGIHPGGFDDSKKLSTAARQQSYQRLVNHPGVVWNVVAIGSEIVDRLNILRATQEGMRQAVLGLSTRPAHVLIDGLAVHPFPVRATAIVKGDGISLSIAAASIIAKVTRDRLMKEAAAVYPDYGFENHKGYATAEHLAALRKFGPCPLHRRSFAPVGQLVLPLAS